jgi:multidrug resistance efflux pump
MKKHKKLIIALIVIVLIVSIVIFFIIKSKKTKSFGEMQGGMPQFETDGMDENNIKDFGQMSENETDDMDETSKEMSAKIDKQAESTTTLKTTAEVKSALTEKKELHATYYLEEVYVEANDFVKKGENILKYTNGTYLVAPYDCYIIQLNVPDLEGEVLNNHYVEISSSNSLMVTMNVDETNIEKISVGLEAKVEVTSLGKTYEGYVTHVASTGSNGKFEIEIEFENDGDIKIGMTGTVSITI